MADGGTLILSKARARIRGDIFLRAGGLLRIEDADLEIWNEGAPTDYPVFWQGGHLSTLRAAIGGRRERSYFSAFHLDNGLWTAQDTTLHDSGGILVGALTIN